jgi:hypothetical protein
MDSAQHADAEMQRAQRTANGRNSGHDGTRQAQTEASAHTPNRIDTACEKANANKQPRPKQPINKTPTTREPEATPGTAKSAPAAAQPTNRSNIVRIHGVILRIHAVSLRNRGVIHRIRGVIHRNHVVIPQI